MTLSPATQCALCLCAAILLAGCEKKFDPSRGEVSAAGAADVIETSNAGIVNVANPEKYPAVAAEEIDEPDKLSVTGSVFPDIARELPVISLANGRVVDIRARLDDNVKKGQLLFSVQSPDISAAFDTYVKAVADEDLANKAWVRAQDLYQHGAISKSMLEQADDTERDAKADLVAAEEQLKIFGVDKDHPSPIVNVYAPVSGVIVAQNITEAAAAGVNLSGSATAFTVADLSTVWILCDVYENDLPKVHLGQEAQIRLDAYPDHPLTGRISDIGPVLDPNIRTAKVRIEVPNPGMLRLGMFVTATFFSREMGYSLLKLPHAY
jgi:membrane fusion protein, heavy metal efflux system